LSPETVDDLKAGDLLPVFWIALSWKIPVMTG